jgi:hypothetical protein
MDSSRSRRRARSGLYTALAVLTVWLGACSETAGPPRVQVTPVAADVSVAAGSSAQVAVRLTLPEGFHVNANTPRDPALIPLVLTVELQAGVTVTEITYPTPIDLEQHGAREPLAVYERELPIAVVLSVAEHVAPGEIVMPARLRYQACDERMCYVPATAATNWTLRVLPAGSAPTSINSAPGLRRFRPSQVLRRRQSPPHSPDLHASAPALAERYACGERHEDGRNDERPIGPHALPLKVNRSSLCDVGRRQAKAPSYCLSS